MNRPATVITYVNIGHFIDHYAMLVFAAAVVLMGPAFGMGYGELLPYATPGFIAFGAGALVMGWLGDRWSRRHMMAVFFLGIGASLVGAGFVQSPLQLGVALFFIGLFAAIYHPVGTAMLVSYAERVGHEVGRNGVWGNFGVALSALLTGAISQYLGWRAAFILPGVVTIAIGVAFLGAVRHEVRQGHKTAKATARVPASAMPKVILALALAIIASSTTFNAVTVSLPKLFAERLSGLATDPALLGLITAAVYVCGAATQVTIGGFLDRHSLRSLFLPMALLYTPTLLLASVLDGVGLILAAVGIVVAMFGMVTVNDAMIGRFTADEWRSRAFALRYFIGFTGAGASVALVAWLHGAGGFALMLQALAVLCLLMLVAAAILPTEERVPEAAAQPAE